MFRGLFSSTLRSIFRREISLHLKLVTLDAPFYREGVVGKKIKGTEYVGSDPQ